MQMKELTVFIEAAVVEPTCTVLSKCAEGNVVYVERRLVVILQ